jgi:hypothetical protein
MVVEDVIESGGPKVNDDQDDVQRCGAGISGSGKLGRRLGGSQVVIGLYPGGR